MAIQGSTAIPWLPSVYSDESVTAAACETTIRNNNSEGIKMTALVLVTGPSGFIGAHVFSQLLEKGYSVRGTVRSQSKADFFLRKFPEAAESGRISFAIIKDIAKPGAFKDALKGTGCWGFVI
jgi:GDP-mannose 4,6 dehydratase